MGEMVRVTLLPKDADGDAAADRQIVIDMAVDAAGSAIGPFPAFGRIGDFRKPETLYPFTLMMDGRIDTGAYAGDEARQGKLAIRSTPMTIGAEVAHGTGDRTETFVIATVTSLAAG